jgi:hypothetical protein
MDRCIPRYFVPYEPHASCCTNKRQSALGDSSPRKVKADEKEVKRRELKEQRSDKHERGKDVPL